MRYLRLLNRLLDALTDDGRRVSYAQCGEDLIVRFLFQLLGVNSPSYLDIGAHHATYLSNTYLLYRKGCRGVCIEPNPTLLAAIKRERPLDTCLNIGVNAVSEESLTFYILDEPTLSTFSEVVVRELTANGKYTVKETLLIPVSSIEAIIETHFKACPNFISLDTEGMDMEILQTFPFHRYRPDVFCIETVGYTDRQKITDIYEYMIPRGYRLYADTYVNSIFVENGRWETWQKNNPSL